MVSRLWVVAVVLAVVSAVSVGWGEEVPKVFGNRIEPVWLEDGHRFWYVIERSTGEREIVLVDAETGARTVNPASLNGEGELESEEKIRPSKSGGAESNILFRNELEEAVNLVWIDLEGNRVGYGSLGPGKSRIQHTYAGHVWAALDLEKRIRGVYEAQRLGAKAKIAGPPKKPGTPPEPKKSEAKEPGLSPNQTWQAYVVEHDLWVRNRTTQDRVQLSHDATPKNSFHRSAIRSRAIGMNFKKSDDPATVAQVFWSPDSTKLLALQTTVVPEPRVEYLKEATKDGSYPYLRAGDPIPTVTVRLFDVERQVEIPIDASAYANAWHVDRFRWAPDSSRFTFLYNQRGHQVLRVLSVDAETGKLRILVNEESETFINYSNKTYLEFLDDREELVWMSERTGWNHLYRYDAKTGEVKNTITQGEWLVRRAESPKQGMIRFFAGGIHPGQSPYHRHLCRVKQDGSDLKILTEGNGDHEIQWSPNGRWFIDTWSRPDQPPVHELRRADGTLVCELERAMVSGMEESGYRLPTPFVAKGRDGKMDIHGLIHWPKGFDSTKRYPVIEQIYAGPHGHFVPTRFRLRHALQETADAGFIVVQIDGMGTNWRSKAFHDVAWKNLGDSGFPDRIAWMQAAAKQFPAMDLERVGIYGGSAGAQSAMRALIAHGDFYDVASATCGCHDNRLDKIWWNEAWMGWPVGEHYAASSNIDQAHRLQGKLLLIVGAKDRNVDPASTTKTAEALRQAGKDFELMILPDGGHGDSAESRERRLEFFKRHLLEGGGVGLD